MAFYLSDLTYLLSDTFIIEFSVVLNIDHTSFLNLALPLVSVTSLSNDSPAISLVFLSRFWSLVPLSQSSPEILAFLQNRAWVSDVPHKLRLNFISATYHLQYYLPGPICYHLLPELLQQSSDWSPRLSILKGWSGWRWWREIQITSFLWPELLTGPVISFVSLFK